MKALPFRKNFHIFIITLAQLLACGQETKDEEKKKNDPVNGSNNSATSVAVVGSLSISKSSLALRAEENLLENIKNIEIFCSTYGENPKTCTIPVDEKGKFEKTCEDLVKKPFSCVLRENGIVVGDFTFETDPTIVSGNGKIEVSAAIDASTGDIQTTINKEGSDALSEEKQASSQINEEVDTAWTKDLEGSWQISCKNSSADKGFEGSEYCPDGKVLHFAKKSTNDGSQNYSVWEAKSAYDACLSSDGDNTYTEMRPNWHIKINGDTNKKISFLFSDQEKFSQTMSEIYSQLPTEIKTSLDDVVDAIFIRATMFKSTIDQIRQVTSKDFGGILEYRVPDKMELKNRMLLKLIHMKKARFTNLDFCQSLQADETITSAYRRIHSIDIEMICQFKSDNILTQVQEFVENTFKDSCLPDLFYDVVFDSAEKIEKVILFCPGSSQEDGSCFDSEQNFIGNIHGVVGTMLYEGRKNGVFDLYTRRVHEKNIIHPKNGLKSCKILHQSTIKAEKSSDDAFTATVSNNATDRCEGSGASEHERDFFGSKTSTQIERYAKIWEASFLRVSSVP